MKYELRSTLASNHPADVDDAWLAKKTLTSAGYYKVPKHGLTPYPDAQLFKRSGNSRRKKVWKSMGF